MFDSGVLNLDPTSFDKAVAVSSGNSLYASKVLLRDPYCPDEDGGDEEHGITHLLGNVGKPGLSIIVLVNEPVLKEANLDSWDVDSHNSFDNVFQDSFGALLCISHSQAMRPQLIHFNMEHGTKKRSSSKQSSRHMK